MCLCNNNNVLNRFVENLIGVFSSLYDYVDRYTTCTLAYSIYEPHHSSEVHQSEGWPNWSFWNKELFENAPGAPPYMIMRQTSKLFFKLPCIHVQIFTNEFYDKSVSYSLSSFPKSIWILWQIFMTLVTNTQKRLKQIHRNIMTSLNDTSNK